MTTHTERLAELGYELPAVAKPLAAYVPAIVTGNQVWTSGQLPMLDGDLVATGRVGDQVTVEQAVEAARVCALNAIAAAGAAAGGVDRITRVIKAVVYVASSPDFTSQPKVGNGASELFALVFGSEGQHVRSAVGVTALPLGAPVEVELVVEFTPGENEVRDRSEGVPIEN